MALYELTKDRITLLERARLSEEGLTERGDLQRLLREVISAVAPGAMVLAEEFGEFEDSRRRIDLLCLDSDAALVVVELKRGEEGGHMDLQAIRYAAMVDGMTFAQAVAAHARDLARRGLPAEEAEGRVLAFLGWDAPDPERFARDVRLVMVASDFSKEVTSTALWLLSRGIEARCVRLGPHRLEQGRLLLDVQQIVPLPEAADYQVRLRDKAAEVRGSLRDGNGAAGWDGWWFVNIGERPDETGGRSWEDCRRWGFVSAGGGSEYSGPLRALPPGSKILAYLIGHGYVGAGTVTGPAAPRREFRVGPDGRLLSEVSPGVAAAAEPDERERAEWCLPVRWLAVLDRANAVRRDASRRQVVCRLRDQELVAEILKELGMTEVAG